MPAERIGSVSIAAENWPGIGFLGTKVRYPQCTALASKTGFLKFPRQCFDAAHTCHLFQAYMQGKKPDYFNYSPEIDTRTVPSASCFIWGVKIASSMQIKLHMKGVSLRMSLYRAALVSSQQIPPSEKVGLS